MYTYIKDKTEFPYSEFFTKLESSSTISIDTEASSLDVFSAKWLLLQIRVGGSTYLLDCRTLDNKFLSYIISIVKSSGRKVIAHNAKYDLKIIKQNTGILLDNIHDTMLVESFLFKGIGKVFYSLKELVEKYCGETLDKDIRESFILFSGDQLSEEQLVYSALDVHYLQTIHDKQMLEVKEKEIHKVYNLEMSLVPVVVSMEMHGVLLDVDAWKALENKALESRLHSGNLIREKIVTSIDYGKYANGLDMANSLSIPCKRKSEQKELEGITMMETLSGWVKEHINIDSPTQLKKVLTTVFGFNIESTDEKILKDIPDNTIIPLILDYRDAAKKTTTYGTDFLKHINTVTGRIHSEFIQQRADSGRFSSANPNLQNIPAKRTDGDPDYRSPFVSKPEHSLIALDYSQQEYRLAGAISQDPLIIEAYKLGKDMHTATASIIFEVPLDKVTKDQRSLGKTINFAVLYGSTEFGLSFKLKIDIDKAKEFLIRFYNGYPTLTIFKQLVENEIWKRKCSSTLLGRKRYFEDKVLYSDYKEARSYEGRVKREGFNHIIQGTGADVTKLAMVKMFRDNPFGEKYNISMQIHDEIVVEVRDDILEEAEKFSANCMISVFQPFLGEIPALVESRHGKCWSK